MIRDGKVALVILAADPGTSIDSALSPQHSIGHVDLDLPSGKPIFQILIERFLRIQQIASNSAKKSKQY